MVKLNLKRDPKELIIKVLRGHPEGLMLIEIAEITGMNRFTVTKYVHELMGAGSLFQKQAAAARLCYLKKSFIKNDNKRKNIKGTSNMNVFLLISTMFLIGFLIVKTVSSQDQAPPLWRYQVTNDTDNIIREGEAINLNAQGYDETGLDWAWLATNETGSWKNKTKHEYVENDIEDSYECGGYMVANCSYVADENWNTYAESWESVAIGAYENYTLDYQAKYITKIKIQTKVMAAGSGYFAYVRCWNYSGNNWLELGRDDVDTVTILNITNTSSEIKGCLVDDKPFMILMDCQTGSGKSRIYETKITQYAIMYAIDMSDIAGTWAWSNYTWINSSTPQTTVIGWKIYYNDTSGNENATDVMTFEIRDTIPPQWFNNQSQLVTTYTPTGYSNFSITWNDNSGKVYPYLEHNFSGTLENTSMSGTYPNFYYNSTSMAAETYQFRFLANDSHGNENATDIQTFTINKVTPSGYQSALPSWTNDYGTTTTVTCYLDVGDIGTSLTLERDGSPVNTGVQPSETIVLGGGSHIYTCDYPGSQNYSFTTLDTDTMTINKLPTLTKLYINGTDTNREFAQGALVNFTVTVNISGKIVKLNTNFTGWVIPSGISPYYNYTVLNYKYGIYSITGYFEGDENYTASSESHFLTIISPVVISIDLNESNVRWGDSVNVSGIVKRVNQTPLSNVAVKLTFDGKPICLNMPNTSSTGWYTCVFNTPHRIKTGDVHVQMTDPLTGELVTNTTILKIKVLWGSGEKEMEEAGNVGCYEVPKIIQNPDGSIRRVLVRLCVWK